MRKLLIFLFLIQSFACSSQDFFSSTFFVNDSEQVPGRTVSENTAHLFYDFTQTTGSNGASISNGNAGLIDRSGNAHDATIIGTPVVRDLTINAVVIKTVQDNLTNSLSTGITGATILNQDFNVFFVAQNSDGQTGAATHILGGIAPVNIGLNIFFTLTGNLSVAFGTTSGFAVYSTTLAAWQNGTTNADVFRVRLSYTDGNIRIFKNDVELAGSYTSGSFSSFTQSQVATDFTTTMYVGSLNNSGVPTSNTNTGSLLKLAIFPIPTGAETFIVSSVQEYLADFTWEDWETKEIHVTTGNASTIRSDAIADYFNGSGLPTFAPTIVTGVTGTLHLIAQTADISNISSWDRYAFTMNDIDGHAFTNYVYLGHTSQTPNGKLFINSMGHNSDCGSCHEDMMERAALYGYDVAFTAMVVGGDNIESCPDITSTSSTAHNQMLSNGIDRVGYCPIELFLFDKFSLINDLDASYTDIIAVGNSGGGWTAAILGALDERVTYTFPIRGAGLRTFKVQETAIDYEQGGMPGYIWTLPILGTITSGTRLHAIFTDVTYFDLFALGTTSGRTVQLQTHYSDTCCLFRTVSWVWMDTMKSLAGQFGGNFSNIVDFNGDRATHGYSYFDINNVFHTLGDL